MCFNLSSYFLVENLNFDFTCVKEIFASKKKLLRTIIITYFTRYIFFIKICGLNGFPLMNTFTTDCTYILPAKKEKERWKNFHHRNLRAEKKKERSFLFLPTFKLQLINAPFFRVEKFRKFSVLTN